MSTGELLYEISRYDVSEEAEVLTEQVQLVRRGTGLWLSSAGGPEVRRSGDVAAVIGSDPKLNEVRADEVTRITAGEEALRELPFLLRIPGEGSDFDEDLWSQAMAELHLDDSNGNEREVYRVLYVNGDRWGAFHTTMGERLLPDHLADLADYRLPSLDDWGQLTFGESASRTYGLDRSTIGLATSAVVVRTALPDEDEDEIRVERRGDDDAATFLDWLLSGSLAEKYFSWSSTELGEALLAQLFVEVIGGAESGVVAGDYLVVGHDVDPDLGMMGIHSSSEWTLDVNLEHAMVDTILDRLAARGGRLRDIVTAYRDPESSAAQARRAAVDAIRRSED